MPAQPAQKKSFLAVLSEIFERKTIKAFAYRVKACDDLDGALRDAIQPHLEPGDPLQMILFAPAQSVLQKHETDGWRPGFLLPWEITPERTLVLTSRQLIVASTQRSAGQNREVRLFGESAAPPAATTSEPVEIASIPFSDMLYLEAGSILLSSWTEITWVCEGRLERTRIHYNTVCRGLFEELIARIRQGLLPPGTPVLSTERPAAEGLELLESMPFKFKNLIPLRLLLPGEKIRAAVFRPSIWKKEGFLFNRHLAPKMALVRTDDYLILAQEDLTADEDTYGLIAQFCPLSRLRCAELQESAGGLELALILTQRGVECQLRHLFQSDARAPLQAALRPLI